MTSDIYPISLHDALPISAAWHAARTDALPVEKFSMAGTRPYACSAKKVTSAPREVGSSTPTRSAGFVRASRSEEHTSELQSHVNLVCRLLLEKKNKKDEL